MADEKDSQESIDYRAAMRAAYLRKQREKAQALFDFHMKYTCGFAENLK